MNKVEEQYFDWMCGIIHSKMHRAPYSFNKLLEHLYDTEFTYSVPKDSNRAANGVNLRYQFAYDTGCACADSYLEGPCSILEMMVSLSMSMEEIMDDPRIGNRTAQWFWSMIANLGLDPMTDNNYNVGYVNEVIFRFLNRQYAPDGRGGLFTIPYCERDLRRVEIWHQACWYLDTII